MKDERGGEQEPDGSDEMKFDEQQISDVVNRFFSQSSDQRLKYMKGF